MLVYVLAHLSDANKQARPPHRLECPVRSVAHGQRPIGEQLDFTGNPPAMLLQRAFSGKL